VNQKTQDPAHCREQIPMAVPTSPPYAGFSGSDLTIESVSFILLYFKRTIFNNDFIDHFTTPRANP